MKDDLIVHNFVGGGMRFVFLDIDGVLLPYFQIGKHGTTSHHGCPSFDPNCVAELNTICHSGNASIIVSSSWRWYYKDIEVMRSMLKDQGVSGPISGMTPFATEDWLRNDRGGEIIEFMKPLDVESFVIIDDCDMGFEGLDPYWVRTDPYKGIQRHDTLKALDILNS